MLHFCPHVSGCKSLSCYKNMLASPKSTVKKNGPPNPWLTSMEELSYSLVCYPDSKSSQSRSCEKSVNKSTYMTPPHNTPPTCSNPWLCVINRPHWIYGNNWISYHELIQLTFQLLWVFSAHSILQQGPPPLVMRVKKHLLSFPSILPPAAFFWCPGTPGWAEAMSCWVGT